MGDHDMQHPADHASVSPLTGLAYPIPPTSDDGEALERFLEVNAGRKVVVVQGLGFVGAVMALVCANTEGEKYAVIGVDLATPEAWWRIKSLNDGTFPLSAADPKITEFFTAARRHGRFLATHDPVAYSKADIILVDVNLDVQKGEDGAGVLQDYSVNLDSFQQAITTIGDYCREDVLVLVETTVPPGTCRNVVEPILKDRLVKRGLRTDRILLGHSYERVMPGPDYIESIRTFPRVFSGANEASAVATECFLRTIIDTRNCPLTKLSSTNASEMAKVLENAFRAMNIAFVVEWSRFAEEAGVDLFSIVDAIRQRPTHANLMYPGIGVGGYCLTKDPLLASWARQAFFQSHQPLRCSEEAVRTNDQMPTYAFNFLVRHVGNIGGKQILLMGVSYRGDVGDTRFSPVGPFYDRLSSAGASIVLHDPFVPYWREKARTVSPVLADALGAAPDVICVTAMHSDYRNSATVEQLVGTKPAIIIDTLGLFSSEQIRCLQQRHVVKVLGRGDL